LHDGEVIWDPEKRDGVAARDVVSTSNTGTTMTAQDLNLQVSADLPSPTPGFWSYELTITESYDLEKPVVTGNFKSDGGNAKLEFIDSNHYFEMPVLGKTFLLWYDYDKHSKFELSLARKTAGYSTYLHAVCGVSYSY
jgi:hypothetical protein